MSNNKINCIYFESGKSKGYTCHCLRDNSYRHNCPCKFFKPTLKERIHRKMWGAILMMKNYIVVPGRIGKKINRIFKKGEDYVR